MFINICCQLNVDTNGSDRSIDIDVDVDFSGQGGREPTIETRLDLTRFQRIFVLVVKYSRGFSFELVPRNQLTE